MDSFSRILTSAASTGFIKGYSPYDWALQINHLLFADDTILFSSNKEALMKISLAWWLSLRKLQGSTSTTENLNFWEVNCDNQWVEDIARRFNCKVGSWPFEYLGLPLYGKQSTFAFWQLIMDKIDKRLQSWQHNFLSKGGRLTLLKATLTNLPMYYLSLFEMPTKVADYIEKRFRDFLRSGNRNSKSSDLLRWEILKNPMKDGGFGISDVKLQNKSLLAKWIWRFRFKKEAIWRIFIKNKFGSCHYDYTPTEPWHTSSRCPWSHIPGLQQTNQPDSWFWKLG